MSESQSTKSSKQEQCCGNCRFFHLSLNEDVGDCRRNAPVPDRTNREKKVQQWPFVDRGNFCGEYQPLPVLQSADATNAANVRGMESYCSNLKASVQELKDMAEKAEAENQRLQVENGTLRQVIAEERASRSRRNDP
jgi:hypothetical protein